MGKILPILLVVLSLVSGSQTSSTTKTQQKTRLENALREAFEHPFDERRLKTLFEALPKDGEYFIVEGDMLLTEQEVRTYVAKRSREPKDITPGPELLIDNAGDYYKDVAARRLTYAIDLQSFPTDQKSWYAIVARNVRQAAADWEALCPNCKFSFVHLRQHDAAPSHDNVHFIVRHKDSLGKYVAVAFYPHYGPSRRYLSIDPSYFTTDYDHVGVIRHELGHVFGYRHEQLRGVPGCSCDARDGQAPSCDVKDWRPLTLYDPRSVMHYFCGGGGSLKFAISSTDRDGHREQYALPSRSLAKPAKP